MVPRRYTYVIYFIGKETVTTDKIFATEQDAIDAIPQEYLADNLGPWEYYGHIKFGGKTYNKKGPGVHIYIKPIYQP